MWRSGYRHTWDYLPSTLTTTRRTITTKSPALLTAAAVRLPLMAEAMVSPERTNMMMNRMMIPRGVLIMLMIELPPTPPLLPGFILIASPSQREMREYPKEIQCTHEAAMNHTVTLPHPSLL